MRKRQVRVCACMHSSRLHDPLSLNGNGQDFINFFVDPPPAPQRKDWPQQQHKVHVSHRQAART